jgi:hypothetical protein
MAEEVNNTPVHLHDEQEVAVRGIVYFGIVLVATIVVVAMICGWLFGFLPNEQVARTTGAQGRRTAPPGPQLQVDAPEDLRRIRESDQAILNSYGWIDKEQGVVRLPIGRAMDLLAERGLPRHSGGPNAGETGSPSK